MYLLSTCMYSIVFFLKYTIIVLWYHSTYNNCSSISYVIQSLIIGSTCCFLFFLLFLIAIYSPRAENAFSRPRRFLGTSGTSSQKSQGRENAFPARGLYKAFCTEGILSGSGRENCFSALLILSGSGRENHFSARWSHFSPYYRRAEKYFSRPRCKK